MERKPSSSLPVRSRSSSESSSSTRSWRPSKQVATRSATLTVGPPPSLTSPIPRTPELEDSCSSDFGATMTSQGSSSASRDSDVLVVVDSEADRFEPQHRQYGEMCKCPSCSTSQRGQREEEPVVQSSSWGVMQLQATSDNCDNDPAPTPEADTPAASQQVDMQPTLEDQATELLPPIPDSPASPDVFPPECFLPRPFPIYPSGERQWQPNSTIDQRPGTSASSTSHPQPEPEPARQSSTLAPESLANLIVDRIGQAVRMTEEQARTTHELVLLACTISCNIYTQALSLDEVANGAWMGALIEKLVTTALHTNPRRPSTAERGSQTQWMDEEALQQALQEAAAEMQLLMPQFRTDKPTFFTAFMNAIAYQLRKKNCTFRQLAADPSTRQTLRALLLIPSYASERADADSPQPSTSQTAPQGPPTARSSYLQHPLFCNLSAAVEAALERLQADARGVPQPATETPRANSTAVGDRFNSARTELSAAQPRAGSAPSATVAPANAPPDSEPPPKVRAMDNSPPNQQQQQKQPSTAPYSFDVGLLSADGQSRILSPIIRAMLGAWQRTTQPTPVLQLPQQRPERPASSSVRQEQRTPSAAAGSGPSHQAHPPREASDGPALPLFDGNPLQLEHFCRSFYASTGNLGRSNEEHLRRIRAALRGPPLQLVLQDLDSGAASAHSIIAKLSAHYGPLAAHLRTLVNLVCNSAPCSHDSELSFLQRYLIQVGTLIATIRHLDLGQMLHDHALVGRLLYRLPARVWVAWTVSRLFAGPEHLTLVDLERFLSRCCEVLLTNPHRPANEEERVLQLALAQAMPPPAAQHQPPFAYPPNSVRRGRAMGPRRGGTRRSGAGGSRRP